MCAAKSSQLFSSYGLLFVFVKVSMALFESSIMVSETALLAQSGFSVEL